MFLNFLSSLNNFILDTLFPWECFNCGKESKVNYPLCKDCFLKIQLFNQFICPICQKRVYNPNKICHSGPIKALGVVGFYEDEILKEAILTFKYKRIVNLSIPLSALLIFFLKENTYFVNLKKENLMIVPVPLHLKRLNLRGFNQAELLAQKVTEYFSLELGDNILIRRKNTFSQAEIKEKEKRFENIKNAFQVLNPEKIKNKTILLIDDVFTSGATLNEAAKTLKQNGAKSIIGLVLAKG